MKRFIALILTILMVWSVLPVEAIAEEINSVEPIVSTDEVPERNDANGNPVISDDVTDPNGSGSVISEQPEGSVSSSEGQSSEVTEPSVTETESSVVSSIVNEEPSSYVTDSEPSSSVVQSSEPVVPSNVSEVENGEGTDEPTLTFTVTFLVDGETYATRTVAEGGTLGTDMPEAPAKDGYRFDKWLSGETEFKSDTAVTADISVDAAFVKTYEVRFHNRDGEVISTRTINEGSAIGDLPDTIAREDYNAYWAVGTASQGAQGTEWTPGTRIDSSYVVNGDVDIVPDYEMITYTITFYTDDTKTEKVAEKTVNVNSNYSLNEIPTVPSKNGYSGKWVYSGGDFSNDVRATADMDVWAEYDQNIFTVRYISDGKTYETDTYYKNDTLVLPTAPVVEGKEFQGWFKGETEYVGGESVISDLTLTAKFIDQYSVTFLVEGGEQLSQYFRTIGETIGQMPQNPFVAGKVFEKWVLKGTESEVTADTVVTGNMIVEAKFREIKVYNITTEYFYKNDSGNEVIFNTDLLQVEEHELPYKITPPASTKTVDNEVSGGPIYYASTPTVTVTKDNFDNDNHYTVRVEYVKYTAEYDFVYMLKDLDGEGYTEIERAHQYGVLHSTVTPVVKTYNYANFESAETAEITQTDGQEVKVYYTRKNFSVSYETNGGSYIAGATVQYGDVYALSSTEPTRAGYTFAGWYKDAELTNRAGNTEIISANTVFYAKWNPDTVQYTIVYMFEKYDDTGKTSSYVYDNSRDATGTVGTTVQASSAPSITRTGWEVDTAKNASSSVAIAADGSSVLFVYYKLREYTLTFDRNHQRGANDYIIQPNGTHTTSAYSINVKLGQDISTLWPSAGSNYYSFMGWQKNGQGTRYVTKQLIMNTDLLPTNGTNITYYASWGYAYTFTVNYYLQNADDDGYTRSDAYSQTYNANSYGLSPKEISGYTFDHGNNEEYVFTYNLYYNRDKYNIDYYYGSNRLDTIEDIKFDATITSATYNWTPTAAECGVDSDYTFAGWYSDAGLTTKYTFSKMPASNLVLYAKWNAPKFNVTFVDGDNTSTIYSSLTDVEKYSRVSAPETTPVKDGYVFDGWFTTADGDTLYDWTKQITENTVIYAHWTAKMISYTVKYVDEAGNEVATSKVVSNPNNKPGDVITENAIAVAGYRPDKNSDTLTLTGNDNDNVITFVYSAKTETTSYTVNYVIADGEAEAGAAVAESKTVIDVPGDAASVIELAKAVDYTALYAAHPELEGIEFFPDQVEKTLVLTADPDNNVLTFYYSSFKNATVTVNYVDMNGEAIADPHTEILKVGKTFTLSRTPIASWEINKTVVGTEYSGNVAGNEYKITEAVTEQGLVFTIFYQKKVTITANSFSKQYDGTVLTLPDAISSQVNADGLLTGDTLSSVDFTYVNNDSSDPNGRVNAGIATVIPGKATITGAHDTSYYKIRYISGTLEVTKINVTIRIEPDRWTGAEYNGEIYETGFTNPTKGVDDYIMISHEGYNALYLDDIWELVKTKATYDGTAAGLHYYGIAKKDAGDYTYNINITTAELPANDNYSVSLYVRPGRLQILPKKVTVITGSDEKQYDGTPLVKTEIMIIGIIDSEKDAVDNNAKVTGTITAPGTKTNTYEIDWATANVNKNNYSITENLGTLTVTKGVLNVTVNDKTEKYNGSAQNGNDITEPVSGTGNTISIDAYTITGLATGDVLSVDYTPASGKDAGTYTNGSFVSISITKDNADITGFYEITSTPGKLIIEKRNVTITSVGGEKVYDGKPLTKNNPETDITVTGDGFVDGEGATYNITGSITNVGSTDNTFEYALNANTLQSNYDIKIVFGELKINKATLTVTITGNKTEATYDGTEKTASGYKATSESDLFDESK
ncbi:MAG: InlB B-repeat-containing protein, partial [Clostridia bacterium]|nr:InlB B-repeat-containing protein [Clostridia bacterium]